MRKNFFSDSLFHDPTSPHKSSLLEGFLLKSNTQDFSEDQTKELSTHFLKRGEIRLLQGDLSGLRYFDLSTKLDPTNPKLFYEIGLALFEFGSRKGREKNLLKAARAFKGATKLKPDYFEAYRTWGNALYLLGKTTQEHHYFQKSLHQYEEALKHSAAQPVDTLADLKWDIGLVLVQIGNQSGEALDLKRALSSFDEAAKECDKLPIEFWQDYGQCTISLSQRLNDLPLFQRGIDYLKNAVSIELDSFESWFKLASHLTKLYAITLDDDTFSEANECFTTAAGLSMQDPNLWEHWAELLKLSGQVCKDPKKLSCAIDKCKVGLMLKKEGVDLLLILAEALALRGQLLDDLPQIYEAQNKLQDAIDRLDHLPKFYASYGLVLEALSGYFDDLDLTFQAIEKYQQGLSLNRTFDRLWFAMGLAYQRVGHKEDSIDDLQLSERFLKKAIALKPDLLAHIELARTYTYLAELSDDQELAASAVSHFEYAFSFQQHAIYLHPDWYFDYALALDLHADYEDSTELFQKAHEILNNVLMVDPDFPLIHHRLALVLGHFADASKDHEIFALALHHYRLATLRDSENDAILLDYGVTCINFAKHLADEEQTHFYYGVAQQRLTDSAKLGNGHAHYQLGCLFALNGEIDKALVFIEKADRLDALPSLEELHADEWLDNLRSHEPFINLIERVKSRAPIQ